jgi:hypothetical protein
MAYWTFTVDFPSCSVAHGRGSKFKPQLRNGVLSLAINPPGACFFPRLVENFDRVELVIEHSVDSLSGTGGSAMNSLLEHTLR